MIMRNNPELYFDMALEEYYRDPIMESWTYVGMGMDKLKEYDPHIYKKIKEKQDLLLPEINERIEYIKEASGRLGLDFPEVKYHIDLFLQKFPLAIRSDVGWDDPCFIFLYLLTKIIKPKVIVESGSNIGFSSSFIALAVKENNNNCKFYTIEPYLEYEWKTMSFIESNNARKQKINYSKVTGKCGPLAVVPPDIKEHISLKTGYSEDVLPRLLQEDERVDIFFHDSEHSYKNMIWECACVLPRLKSGGYILVHDIFQNSAFKEMFGRKGGVVIKENLGVYKKADEDLIIKKDWSLPAYNSQLNDSEYESGKVKVQSSPKNIIIQVNSPCSAKCVFCPGNKNGREYNFDNFYQKLEGKLSQYISQAEKITFETCASFSGSSEIERMIRWHINCIELSFPEIEKIYFTNGFDLTPEVCDFIVHPGGILSRKYTVRNTVNILLNASNENTYKILTRTDNFLKVLNQIGHLINLKKDKANPKVYLTFLMNTLNIEDMPDFVRLASDIGVDKAVCSYNYIFSETQKYLSCFFKQEMTNEFIDKTKDLAGKLKMDVSLPPKFSQHDYPQTGFCRRAWDQIVTNAKGDILTCDRSEECNENLLDKDLMDIWNGPYYQNLRKNFLGGNCECFKYCFRENPEAVNDFRSHVVLPQRNKTGINILWADNF